MSRWVWSYWCLLVCGGMVCADDAVHLKSGGVERGIFKAVTDTQVILSQTATLPGGASAGATRTFALGDVDYLEFGWFPGEEAALADPTIQALESLWEVSLPHLHRPRSRAGAVGLALGQALLGSGVESDWKRALRLLEVLETKAWDSDIRARATAQKVNAWIRLGDFASAENAARALLEQGNPVPFIELRYAKAGQDFVALRLLEQENPKWQEDEEIRPERMRLLQEALDALLYPSLFHGGEANLAARGLLAAAEVNRFSGLREASCGNLADLLALYPESSSAERARQLIAELTGPSPPQINPPSPHD